MFEFFHYPTRYYSTTRFWAHYPTLPYPKLKNHYPSGPGHSVPPLPLPKFQLGDISRRRAERAQLSVTTPQYHHNIQHAQGITPPETSDSNVNYQCVIQISMPASGDFSHHLHKQHHSGTYPSSATLLKVSSPCSHLWPQPPEVGGPGTNWSAMTH